MLPLRNGLQSMSRLLLDFGIRVGGCFSKFFRCPSQVASAGEHRAQIEMSFAEIRTQANRLAVFHQRGIDASAIFKQAPQHVVGFG